MEKYAEELEHIKHQDVEGDHELRHDIRTRNVVHPVRKHNDLDEANNDFGL